MRSSESTGGDRPDRGGHQPLDSVRRRPRTLDAVLTASASPPPSPFHRLSPQARRTVLGALIGVGVVAMAVTTAVGMLVLYDYSEASVPTRGASAIASPTVLLDVSGKEIGKLDPNVVGTEVATADLPQHVVRAVLAAEDRRFYSHGGYSTTAILRAASANVTSGSVQQGASTITQQYVDLTTTGSGETIREKLREVVAAVKVDRALGKDEILGRYLNLVPFGRDVSGVDAAAKTYFGVAAVKLDVNQAATLAGMIAAPSAYDPGRHPEAARTRRDVVLRAMGEQGWLPPARVEELVAAPLPEVTGEKPGTSDGPAAYFVDAVRRELEARLPEDRDLGRGLVVQTTVDMRMQELAHQTLRTHVGGTGATGSIVSVDPATGEVRALVGGPSFAEQRYNTALQARRQAGSAFKPFTLAAFVEDGYDPTASRYDAPAEMPFPERDDPVGNFGDRGYGQATVRGATVKSINTVYAQLVRDIGPRKVAEVARAMGIRSELPEQPSLALGAGSVQPLEMASAYATLAARGTARTPTVVREVRDIDGEVIHSADVEEQQAIDEQTAGVVTDVLADVVERGTGTAAQIGRPVAGKTGTTTDSRDAWFVGFAPQLATSVWVGRLDNAPMPDATGGGTAAPIWSDYMQQALAPMEVARLPTAGPSGLRARDETTADRSTPSPTPSPSSSSPTPSGPPSPKESASDNGNSSNDNPGNGNP